MCCSPQIDKLEPNKEMTIAGGEKVTKMNAVSCTTGAKVPRCRAGAKQPYFSLTLRILPQAGDKLKMHYTVTPTIR